MNININFDPILGHDNDTINDCEDEFVKWSDGFNLNKYLTGDISDQSNDLSWINDEEVDAVAEFFKPPTTPLDFKTEVLDQGVVMTRLPTYSERNCLQVEIPSLAKQAAPTAAPIQRKPLFRIVRAYDDPKSEVSYGSYNEQHDPPGKSDKRPPRRYNLKPEREKKTRVYQEKRERNNDAVRKCREKAKLKQQEKDDLLEYYQKENEQLVTENEDLRNQLLFMARNCQCGLIVEVVDQH